ncbi:MAG: protein kinase domain-containing protein [Gemmatimonadales bacterium]
MITEFNSVALLAARLADRYAFERELGRGMATVYLARDLRHDRLVALKFLRPEVSSALAAERFQREIAIAARLTHPHILPLLDSGSLDDPAGRTILYYAMPYVDGHSVSERLKTEPPLPLAEAVRLATQIAQVLDHAHAQGVVHRDIKPENILVSGGQAIVADFGIASALDLAGGEKLTQTGFVLGTPAYMSPEQGVAAREIDGRSDIYSLGSVLYEMLAGEPPYTGPNVRAVIAKRLSEPVPRISVLRETVPPQVEKALLKALATAPADRFATAGEFASALTAAGTAALPPPRAVVALHHRRALWAGAGVALAAALGIVLLWSRTREATDAKLDPNVVAVLPFRVTARDTSYHYLREGVVDLLSARLTGDGLPRAVDSRTTLSRWRQAMAARGAELTTPQAIALARGLGAGRLLPGEFVVTPARMSVSGRLLRVPDGEIVAEYSEAGRTGAMDELALLDRLIGRMLALTAGEHRGRLPHLSDSVAAVKAYLAGRQKHRRGEFEAAAELALDRLERLMGEGIGHLARAGNVTNLLLARRFEARGDVTGALRAVRRRPQNYKLVPSGRGGPRRAGRRLRGRDPRLSALPPASRPARPRSDG